MSFTAHVQGLQLPDVLQVVSSSRQSGIATIIHSGAVAKLVFLRGRVVYATSDTQSRLGYSLVQKNIISEEDLQRALERQKEMNCEMPLASVLVKLGIVYPGMLEKETREQIIRVLSDMLGWQDGMFYFEPQEILDTRTVLKEGLSVEALLIEAAAHYDTEVQLDRELCDFWQEPA